MTDEAILTNDSRFTKFIANGKTISFKTPKSLERYSNILKWDNGYLEVMAVYNGKETVEYIDLVPILENLLINSQEFLRNIKRVKILYD